MFKIGDKVKYISGSFGDRKNNPVWGGAYGFTKGIVVKIINPDQWIVVDWGNFTNAYRYDDLELIEKNMPAKINKIFDEIISSLLA